MDLLQKNCHKLLRPFTHAQNTKQQPGRNLNGDFLLAKLSLIKVLRIQRRRGHIVYNVASIR